MAKRILLINGHPDPRPERLCAALTAAYAEGAAAAGHEVRRLDIGALEFPVIRRADEFVKEPPPDEIVEVQQMVLWCELLVLVHPPWLGGAPALTKGFLEQ